MKHLTKSGAVLAAAALSLAMSGAAFAPAQAEEAKVHCAGINSCKGTSECKSASSACKGQNACKGHGWVSATTAECTDKGGTVVEG
jgi:uncharacterized membrane protein